MNTVDPYLAKFQELLRALFQFDCQDLDFGIYRVLNYRRKQVEEFISNRLPQVVAEAVAQYAGADRETTERELQQKRQEIVSTLGAMAFDATGQLVPTFRETPLGRQFLDLEQKAKAGQVSEELQASVYNDLHAFFSRYYEDGDIFPRPRRGRVEIPFTGHEDTVLHWANRDQYYIKTGEQFKSYRFKADDFAAEFSLRNATTEQNNNRGEKRYFVLADESPVVFDEKTGTLEAFLEYRPLTDKEKAAYGKTETQKPQEKLNAEAEQAILKRVKDATLKAYLAKPTGEDKPSLLLHHLARFTRKNTTDFFIHKDLKGFMVRELGDFLKAEVLRTDELLASEHLEVSYRTLLRAQVVRHIAVHIIDFLSQVENFQKKLFEKRKFVVRTEYCITLDRLAEPLWDDVLKNKAQVAEWQRLYGLDDLLKRAKKKRPDHAFLKAHDKLVVDTRHFSEEFKWRLLAAFDDLDASLDGLLVKSENFQALALLLAKYRERVKCIYIDPPYNTGSDEFIYRDSYQHSCWLSMMIDRTTLGREFLEDGGVLYTSIDNNELAHYKKLLQETFAGCHVGDLVWKNATDNNPTRIATEHEYVTCFARDMSSLPAEWKSPYSYTKEQLLRYYEQLKSEVLSLKEIEKRFREFIKDNAEIIGELERYKFVDGEGPYTGSESVHNPHPGGYDYDIFHAKTKKPMRKPLNGYRFPWETMKRDYIDKDRLIYGPDENRIVKIKLYLRDYQDSLRSVILLDGRLGAYTLSALFGKDSNVFDNPKPVELLERLISFPCRGGGFVMDFFAGSGTSEHAIIKLNRQNGVALKFLMIEMGEWFDSVILPRSKKVVFCEDWKDSKPEGREGVSHFAKYHVLEQYEDTLNNLEMPRAKEGELALQRFGDEYILRYMLEFETQGSSSVLALERVRHPFAYKLRVQEGHEIVERTADLVETFNYLLGLDVKKMRQMDEGKQVYRVVLGHSRSGKVVVIVWRDAEALDDNKDALQKDRQFIEKKVLPTILGKDKKPDRLLVNGACVAEGAEAIELEFHRLMFAPIG